jgi:hypothetical protein
MNLRDRLNFFHIYAKGTALLEKRRSYYKKILAISRTKNSAPYGIVFR